MGKDETIVTEVDNPQHQPSEEIARPAPSKLQSLVETYWIWEVFTLCVSLLALMSIYAVLASFNHKPTPEASVRYWRIHKTFTLNSIIAPLTTVFKSMIIIPVVASIGELKWIWYRKGRQLTDVQLYDGAAKGPLGAVQMLWSLRGRSLACLGAVIVLGSLILDTAFQTLIAYPLKPALVGSSTIAGTNYYNETQHLSGGGRIGGSTTTNGVDGMTSAIYRGLYAVPDATFYANPSCATGNCTWDPFASLGATSTCEDITPLIRTDCSTYKAYYSDEANTIVGRGPEVPYCNYTINGVTLDGRIMSDRVPDSVDNILPFFIMSSDLDLSNETTQHVGTFIVIRGTWATINDTSYNNVSAGLNGTSLTYPFKLTAANATRCDLDVALLKYNAASVKGTLKESIVATKTMPEPYLSFNVPPEWQISDSSGNNLSFEVSQPSWLALGSFFKKTFNGTLYISRPEDNVDFGIANSNNAAANAIGWADLTQLQTIMANVAGSMTQHIRQVGQETFGNGTDGSQGLFSGQMYQHLPHVEVRWQWLAAPVLILVLTAVFLFSTIFVTKQKGATMLWKANGLAPFYHPLTKEGREQLAVAQSASQAVLIAEKLKVKWQQTEAGGRFVPA